MGSVEKWIVFDYGEVIGLRPSGLAGLAALAGVAPGVFEGGYWGFRDAYDRGMSDLEYWRAVTGGGELTAAQAEALTAADIDGWLTADPEVLRLLGELSEGEVGLALLSNAASSHGRAFREQAWMSHFRHAVISGDVGVAKPDPEIWEALLGQLGAGAGNCLFFDDKLVNVEGARAAGLRAEVWTGVGAARGHIERFCRVVR